MSMSSKSDEKASSSNIMNKNLGIDDDDDLLYADLATLSIHPTISPSTTTATSSSAVIPSSSSTSWHLWHYDCRDFPLHNCNTYSSAPCLYCTEVNNLRKMFPNANDESQERWPTYLKPGRAFDDAQSVLRYLKSDMDGVLPSKLARDVFFNHALGTAFFRAGISPKAERQENRDGGSFQLLLLTTTNWTVNWQLIKNFDKLFLHTVQLLSELPEPALICISGVFFRYEINPGKRLPRTGSWNPYQDHTDLPLMGRLEVWIGDATQELLVKRQLIAKIEAQIQILGIPSKACRDFRFLNRTKHWEMQKRKKEQHDQKNRLTRLTYCERKN